MVWRSDCSELWCYHSPPQNHGVGQGVGLAKAGLDAGICQACARILAFSSWAGHMVPSHVQWMNTGVCFTGMV